MIEFEKGTPVEKLGYSQLHRGCLAVIKANMECPYGCGPRKYHGGTDGYSCISDHK